MSIVTEAYRLDPRVCSAGHGAPPGAKGGRLTISTVRVRQGAPGGAIECQGSMAAHDTARANTDAIRCLTIDEDRYERLECIGRGSFGDVYKG